MNKIEQLTNLKMAYQFLTQELANKVAKQRFLITYKRLYKSFVNDEIAYGECFSKIGSRFADLSKDAYI